MTCCLVVSDQLINFLHTFQYFLLVFFFFFFFYKAPDKVNIGLDKRGYQVNIFLISP